MRLNVYENNLSVIIDFEQYCGAYQCIHCDKLWFQNCDYYRHTKSCTTTVREVFPGGIHKSPATIFENTFQNTFQYERKKSEQILFAGGRIILRNKAPCINILVVFSIFVINVIPTETPTVLCK